MPKRRTLGESQRDSIAQTRVARDAVPWEKAGSYFSSPKGLRIPLPRFLLAQQTLAGTFPRSKKANSVESEMHPRAKNGGTGAGREGPFIVSARGWAFEDTKRCQRTAASVLRLTVFERAFVRARRPNVTAEAAVLPRPLTANAAAELSSTKFSKSPHASPSSRPSWFDSTVQNSRPFRTVLGWVMRRPGSFLLSRAAGPAIKAW